MARMVKHNVMGSVTRRNVAVTLAALVTEAGLLVTADNPRVPRIADAAAALIDALIRAGCAFVAKGHGLRWLTLSGLSPLFMDRSGAADGTVYLYGGAVRKDAILSALPPGSVVGSRVENKGGLYVTFNPALSDDDADKVVAFCMTVGSNGRGDGWADVEGWGVRADMPAMAAPPAATEGTPPATEGKGSKPPRRKRAEG